MAIVHDFAYSELCFDGYSAPSLLASPGGLEVGVELYSMSKCFSIPGWRIGFCLGNPRLVSALKKIKSYIDFGIFQPIQIATMRLIELGDTAFDDMRQEYLKRRDILVEGLKSQGWELDAPKATVLLWGKIPRWFEGDCVDFTHQLLEKADLAVCPGVGFEPNASRNVRFALVENESRIRKALERLQLFSNSKNS